jgi:hypothetical protein
MSCGTPFTHSVVWTSPAMHRARAGVRVFGRVTARPAPAAPALAQRGERRSAGEAAARNRVPLSSVPSRRAAPEARARTSRTVRDVADPWVEPEVSLVRPRREHKGAQW